jgi:2-phosphosulfolactate phosphatase
MDFTGPMTEADWHHQNGYDVRFEWGAAGTMALAAEAPVVVVIDVLRFTTAVEAAVERGAVVYPHRWHDPSATAVARSLGAVLADGSDPSGPSLSPVSLSRLSSGDAVVLPSPNGSTCAALAEEAHASVVASCLRNASAVATWLDHSPHPVAVIACGERWPDGSLRPCVEDLLGAGALISHLHGSRSPEAESAAAVWEAVVDHDVPAMLRSSGSGQELRARGHADDVDYAGEIGISTVVPLLVDGRFVGATGGV